MRDHRGDNQADRRHRNRRERAFRFFGEPAPNPVDQHAEPDRNDHHLQDRDEHRLNVHVDRRAQIQVGQRRREKRRRQGVHAGHSHRQRGIPFRQIGDHVARRAAGTRAHQNHADQKLFGKPERFPQSEREQGHDEELRETTDNDVPGPGKEDGEISRFHRQPHPEHHDHQQAVNPPGPDPQTALRPEERERGDGQNDERHRIADEIADFSHSPLSVPRYRRRGRPVSSGPKPRL